MSSVKWLTRIQVLTEPYQRLLADNGLRVLGSQHGKPVRRPLMEMTVKSLIARPGLREMVKGGSAYRVSGAAWTVNAD